MSTLAALLALGLVAFLVIGTFALIGFVLKILFVLVWAILFPIRLALKLVFGLVGVGLAVLLAPLLIVVVGIAIVGAILAAIVAALAPLMPVIFLGLIGWLIYRASQPRQLAPANPRPYDPRTF